MNKGHVWIYDGDEPGGTLYLVTHKKKSVLRSYPQHPSDFEQDWESGYRMVVREKEWVLADLFNLMEQVGYDFTSVPHNMVRY